MPKKNGIEVMKELMEKGCRSSIIVASADSSIKKLALDSGASFFLSKPFLLEELKKTIEKIEVIKLK